MACLNTSRILLVFAVVANKMLVICSLLGSVKCIFYTILRNNAPGSLCWHSVLLFLELRSYPSVRLVYFWRCLPCIVSRMYFLRFQLILSDTEKTAADDVRYRFGERSRSRYKKSWCSKGFLHSCHPEGLSPIAVVLPQK